MWSLQQLALEPSLPRTFKLIKASVPLHDIIGTLDRDHCLLTALFEVDGETISVIVDTGATISFIPEHGKIITTHRVRPQQTNVNVMLADDGITHINKKAFLTLRPKDSNEKAKLVPFYISNGATKVLGHEALIGLNHLKLFSLNIRFYNGKMKIYHNSRCIGHECDAIHDYKGSIRRDNRFDKLESDQQILSILKKYKGVFSDIGSEPIRSKPMRIMTVHQRPIFAKPRNYNPDEIKQMREHITSLLDKKIIEPTNSGYAATSRIIPKKSGAGRLVVNYIPLNAVTLRDSYSLPNIADIFAVIQGQKYFTTMDCTQGFYQILVDPRDRHKTAFSTPLGNYQFVRCPFGARNSCAVFQAAMNMIFADGLYIKCVIYVDDLLIFGKTKEEHDANLAWALAQCEKYNLKIKLEKCVFAKTEVKYLGFSVSGSHIKPLEDKVESLSQLRPPKNKTELRSIVGQLNFYSRFIPNYSKQLEPFRGLLRKNKDFQWSSQQQEAYEKVLNALKDSSSHSLICRSEMKIIELHIMHDSIETMLLDQEEHLISRASRFLLQSEANYSLVEKQLLALVMAIKKFKIWLEPGKFMVRLPSKHLEKVMKLVNRPERVDNLLLKLPHSFDTFQFEVKEALLKNHMETSRNHVPQEIYYVDGACRGNGKPNCIATWAICAEFDRDLVKSGYVTDSPSNNSAELTAAIKACELAKERGETEITIVTDSKYLHSAATLWIDKWLSNDWLDYKKKPVVNTELFKQLLNAKKDLQIEWVHVKGHSENVGNNRADTIARELIDKSTATLCAAITNRRRVQNDSPEILDMKEKIRKGELQDYIIEDDVVYYIDLKLDDKKRVYVPNESRYWLLKLAHDDPIYGGHLGIKKTARKLIKFWWPKMHKDVEYYIKSCDTCQHFKNPTGLPPGYLHSIPVSKVFEHVHLDIVGQMTRTHRGNAYIFTATDAFSKWTFAKARQSITTKDLIDFVEDNIISIYGKPLTIITDRGTQFTAEEWKQFVDRYEIKHCLTSRYHPQSNGVDERVNGTLVRILRAYVDYYQKDWDEKLKWAVYVYNTTVHESTGYSPYQILHGFDPRSPLRSESSDKEISRQDVDQIRTEIREQAVLLNKAAQERQTKEYNKRHKACDLHVGQKVLVRMQAAPRDLSKKFYHKWEGPFTVLYLLHNKNNPKAVLTFDIDQMKLIAHAIQDVKPYHDRDREKYPEELKEKGDALELIDFHSPGYYLSSDKPEEQNSDKTDQQTEKSSQESNVTERQETLTSDPPDLIDLHEGGPVSSSPRRVTISDQIETFSYSPEKPTDINEPAAETQETYVDQNRSEEPSRVSPYLVDFINDNSTTDPTYKPQTTQSRVSSKVPRTAKQTNSQELSIVSNDTSRRNSSSTRRESYELRSRSQKPRWK